MSEKKLSDSELAPLLRLTANVLTAKLSHTQKEYRFNEDGEEVETGEIVHTATPADLAVAVRLLQMNKITCDVEQVDEMNGLRDELGRKRKRSMGNAAVAATEEVH